MPTYHTSCCTMSLIASMIAICYITHAVVTDGRGAECVSSVIVDFWAYSTAKCKRSQGVIVCKEDDRMDQFCQGPAVLACFQQLLEIQRRTHQSRRRFDLTSYNANVSTQAMLTSMCSFVISQGLCASSLFNSPRLRSF